MDTISYSAARTRLASTMKKVCDDHEPVIITRQREEHGLSGYWSRRLDDEHRIVYRMSEDAVLIAQLRYHY